MLQLLFSTALKVRSSNRQRACCANLLPSHPLPNSHSHHPIPIIPFPSPIIIPSGKPTAGGGSSASPLCSLFGTLFHFLHVRIHLWPPTTLSPGPRPWRLSATMTRHVGSPTTQPTWSGRQKDHSVLANVAGPCGLRVGARPCTPSAFNA